jgi:hypothetical protein
LTFFCKNTTLFKIKKESPPYANVPIHVEMFDIYGRKVSNLKSHISNQMNISHLAAGVYFLRVDGQTVKVVKN